MVGRAKPTMATTSLIRIRVVDGSRGWRRLSHPLQKQGDCQQRARQVFGSGDPWVASCKLVQAGGYWRAIDRAKLALLFLRG